MLDFTQSVLFFGVPHLGLDGIAKSFTQIMSFFPSPVAPEYYSALQKNSERETLLWSKMHKNFGIIDLYETKPHNGAMVRYLVLGLDACSDMCLQMSERLPLRHKGIPIFRGSNWMQIILI